MKFVLLEVRSRSVRTIVLLAFAVAVLLSALMGGAEVAAELNDAVYGAGQNDQTSDAISVSGPSVLLVREGTSIGTHLVTYRAIVSPTADLSSVNLVFSIEGTDSGKYMIDPMTGELFTALWIDYETDAIDMFTVVVSGGVHRATLEVTVNIGDVEDSVSTLQVSKANPVPGVYQGNPEHVLDAFPYGFVETEWANWNTILRIEVTSESPESDCGTGLDCVRLHVEADGSEDEQELVAIRTGAQGHKYVAAVKLVESEAEGGETTEVIGEDGTARLVQVLQVGEEDEVEIVFDNLRGSVDVENGPPEFGDLEFEQDLDFQRVDVEFTFEVTDADSWFPEPEDYPDTDGDDEYTPATGLIHDSQCYGRASAGESLEAVDGLSLQGGSIYCDGEPEIYPIRDDRDFDEINDGYSVRTSLILEQGSTYFITYVACDKAGNCTVYDADEDSDALLLRIDTLTETPADPCLVPFTEDITINGAWDGACPSNREPESYGGSGARFARYYSFALDAAADVSIMLTSSEDTYLYLLDGTGKEGPDLYENDDITPGSNLNSRIEQRLQPGEYTIEATTYYSQKTGEFTLKVSGISKPPEDADCSSGIAVTDPDDNPGLVSDCEVLLAARDILAGSAGLNWSAGLPIEEWDGIRIVGSPERVDSLTLNDLELNGVIPAELGLLAHLFLLSLSGNDLSGQIPSELGDLGDLAILSLSGNNLNGAIPHELGDIPYLIILDLSSNQLTGEIPPELGKLTDLLELHLDRNQLVDVIPDELAELENLQSLYLAGNDLTGCIPDGLKDIDASDFANLGLLFCDGTPVVPLPSDPCVVDMGDFESRLEVIDNFWEEQCESTNRPDDGEYYARFFTFDLSVEADVTITLESNPDAYLYLLEGDGQRGSVLFEDDDTEGTNPRIRTTLQPGSYTVEATTYEIGVTGDFRIGVETDELDGRPPITCVEPTPRVLSGQTFGLTYYSEGRCRSMNRPDDGDYYADYFRMPLKFPARVTVALESDEDGYLFLLDGEGVTGEVLHENDDTAGTNPLIVADLKPGVYTIEATTYEQGVTGKFRLEIKVISDAGEQCLYGRAVHDPDTNQALLNDCAVLLEAKNILGAEPSLNWSADVPMEEWEGVSLGGSQQRVTGLHFKDRGLKGEIAAELDYLWGLEELDLTGNLLTGGMPHLGNSRSLEFLNLGANRLSGEINRGWSMPSELEVLYLYNNKLSGEIPSQLGDLENLSALGLDGNRLSGEIPPELGKLSNLDKMHLSDNRLVGDIPDELGDIPNLYGLFLSGNDLSGCIPEGLRDVEENDFDKLGLPFCSAGQPAHCVQPLPSVPAITIEDSWESECISVNRSSGRAYYARYYTLDLSEQALVGIELASEDDDGYLYLLDGEDSNGEVLQEVGGYKGVARLGPTMLQPGNYTIEAATYDSRVEGRFTLRVRIVHESVLQSSADRIALATLYLTTHGDGWNRKTNWLTEAPLSDWHGVITDSAGRAIDLRLGANNLKGELPAKLGLMQELRVLHLEFNDLSGEIPWQLGDLVHVRELRLSFNKLTGPIPSHLGDLSDLEELHLNDNDLSGEIPIELGNLISLTDFNLGHNEVSGAIPPELGKLANLRSLELGSNNLTGQIPLELGNLVNLERLNLSHNWLTGRVPSELLNLIRLEDLRLGFNGLSGNIPTGLSTLGELRILDLARNEFSGEIPDELGSIENLESLFLYYNRLSGEIPVELARATKLNELILNGNSLVGQIPPELGSLTDLQELSLDYNLLTGTIPSEFGDLEALEELNLSHNQIAGEIPPELSNLDNLEELDLSNNLLTGEIPAELGNLSSIDEIDLISNQLTGCIPYKLRDIVFADPELPICPAP